VADTLYFHLRCIRKILHQFKSLSDVAVLDVLGESLASGCRVQL